MFEDVAVYRPGLPMMAMLALAGAVVLAMWWTYGAERRWGWLACRGLALAGLAWVLAGPSVMEHAERAERGRLAVVVDRSKSMGEPDAEAGSDATRLEALQRDWLEPGYLRRVAEAADVELIAFDEEAEPVVLERASDLEAIGEQTHLLRTLGGLVDGGGTDGLAGVVVMSDGHDTQSGADPTAASALAAAGVPVFAVPVGSERESPMLRVQAWAEADLVMDGQSTRIHTTVMQHGYAGQGAVVELRHRGEVIERRPVEFEGARHERVSFEVTPPRPGRGEVEVEAYEVGVVPSEQPEADAADKAEAHREETVFVQVSGERVRVALFEGEPGWETRFLARLLQDDGQVALHAVYRLGPNRLWVVSPEDDERVVLDPEALDPGMLRAFDVIVLGRRAERFFAGDRAAWLVEFVQEHGGGLVLARGEPFGRETVEGRAALEAVEPILPATWGQERAGELALSLTEAGRQSELLEAGAWEDLLSARLSTMRGATRVERAKPASVTLMRAEAEDAGEMPALVRMRAGRGQVLALLGEGLWRWAMLPARLEEHRGVYAGFWTRTVHWLATGGEFLPGQSVALELDRLVVEPGKTVSAEVRTRHPSAGFEPRLRLRGPGGELREIRVGAADGSGMRWRTTWRMEEAGVWEVELDAEGALEPVRRPVAVRSRSVEMVDPSARPVMLEELAEATGGGVWELDEPGRLLELAEGLEASRGSDGRARYDFARWPVLAWVFGWLMLEWAGRARRGRHGG